jgi:hypothetical protein
VKQWPVIRDVILFLSGLGGVAHETVLAHADRPTLLILFAAMMGLPAFLRPDKDGGGVSPEMLKQLQAMEKGAKDA